MRDRVVIVDILTKKFKSVFYKQYDSNNELNIVVMDPSTGTVYKIGMNDATDLFKKYGNSFITYI